MVSIVKLAPINRVCDVLNVFIILQRNTAIYWKQPIWHNVEMGSTEIFCLWLLQSSSLAIIANISMSGIETKYVVKLDLHPNLVYYYGSAVFKWDTHTQLQHNLLSEVQSEVINAYIMFPSCKH